MIAFNRKRQQPIGLHLGPRTVRLVQLNARGEGPAIRAMAEAELPPEEDSIPETRDREVAAIVRRLISDHGFRGRQVASCLGAQDLFVQNVRIPQLPPEEVESVLTWEAAERLPYPVADAELRHIFAGTLKQEGNQKQEVILLACHRGVIERHVQVLEMAGLTPVTVDLEPCAILRSLLPASAVVSAGTRRAYLNLGESATTVIFADGDQILFLKSIAGGGQQLDLAVARHLEIELSEAVRMRASVMASGELDPQSEVHRSVIDSIRAPLEAINSDVELCLRYYKVTFRGKPLDRIVLTGSESSRWMAEFLEERLGTRCELGNPFANVALPGRSAEPPVRQGSWTTAVGLSRR